MRFLTSPTWRIFLIVLLVGLTWSAATGQKWEDFYITYRASKNLAEGKGLTFTDGERVHSFTSPLGVLLPAISYLLTGSSSDTGALWIFRLMSLAALGGGAVLIWRAVRRLSPDSALPAGWLVAMLVVDSKTVCFVTSGMETAFMILFLCWALWAVFLRPPHLGWHLGLAWAGLMWTRPDSCVYIACLALGLLLFQPGEGGFLPSRGRLLRLLLLAGIACAVVYLPWFVWAWSYYGTPVPHTILAKGLFNEVSLPVLANKLLHFPVSLWQGTSSLQSTFMPYYGGSPDWPGWVPKLAFVVALIPLPLFLLPFLRWETRFVSFVYLLGHVYLTVVIGFPVPWYIPHVSFLGLLALALLLGELLARATGWQKRPGIVAMAGTWLPRGLGPAAGTVLVASLSLSVVMARQAWLEMNLIEKDVRTAIGLWLHDQADSPRDTVFLEPLGFIGYFSGLKMLDYPGLCSPEVVAARKRADSRSYPFCWSEIILSLRPDWLVLRPFELKEIRNRDPLVLQNLYDHVRTFDVNPQIKEATLVPIRGYLEYNGTFEVYHLKPKSTTRLHRAYVPLLVPITLKSLESKEALLPVEPAGSGLKAHAPSRLVVPVAPGARMLLGGFGIYEGAYADPPPAATDGAEFLIELEYPDGRRTVLLQRLLTPSTVPADRGLQEFDLDLPATDGAKTILTINAGPANNHDYDWSYWFDLRFGLPSGQSP